MNYLKHLFRYLLIVLCILIIVLIIQLFRNTSFSSFNTNISSDLRVATYNVHYIRASAEEGEWSVSDWERRKEPLSEAVSSLEADIIAFQEMESFARRQEVENLTLQWLREQHPEYTAGAVGDPNTFPSTQPIFYNTERFELLDEGWFFFSETPDVIYSRTFNGSFPAFASWVHLLDTTTGEQMRIVNIHTDFSSLNNREQSLELVAERITPWIDSGEHVLVAGDYNARKGSWLFAPLERLGISFPTIGGSTYHFNRGINLFGAIDHVAYSERMSLVASQVVQSKFLREWPTDHYPVVVDLDY